MKNSPISSFSRSMPAPVLTLAFSLLTLATLQGESPMTYKSGINVNILGTAGTDYAVEEFYHDRTLADHKVVFLKDSTLIGMEHNENNIAGKLGGARDYEFVGLDVGQIVFKPDGDRLVNLFPQEWIDYTAPFSFSELNYAIFGDAEVPVVGSTGDNGIAQTRSNKSTHYYRGILDSVGDEWHTMTVADDDYDPDRNNEFRASDGKVHLFVVNPKTPSLSWAVTGTGQFYTTPPKTYFVAHIYDQTTYFASGDSGSVAVTIRDINGNNVFYRINGGSYTDAGTSQVTLDQDVFKAGENTLEYYYAGNDGHTRMRTVVKDPEYPSAREDHGDRLWLDAENFETHMKTELRNDWWMAQWRTKERHHGQSQIDSRSNSGKRNVTTGRSEHGAAIINALVARSYGMSNKASSTAEWSFADYAKFALFETHTSLDPIGVELTENGSPKPTRELMYRGYYDVRPIYGYAGTYDILAGYYRADQGYANGLTAIEDFFIRDALARWVHLCGLQMGGYTGTPGDPASYPDNTPSLEPGMWTTARFTGAAMIAGMMPNYSTPYYGTSGVNGAKAVGSPFFLPHLTHTWFDIFLDDSVIPTGYPDGLQSPMGMNIQFTEEGKWHDRKPYSDTPLQGMCLGIYYNILKLFHPSEDLPTFDLAMDLAAQGLLEGAKVMRPSDDGTFFRSWAVMLNAWHPEFRAVAQPAALALDGGNSQHPGPQKNTGGPFYILWYDHNLPLPIGNTVPRPPTGLRRLE